MQSVLTAVKTDCTIQTKMSLVTAGTNCTVSQHLWDVAVNCSIAQDRQLQKLSPKVLWVRIMMHVRLSVERSRCSRGSATRRQSSAKYDAEFPDSDRWTSVATLKLTRWRTDSQCSRQEWSRKVLYTVEKHDTARLFCIDGSATQNMNMQILKTVSLRNKKPAACYEFTQNANVHFT